MAERNLLRNREPSSDKQSMRILLVEDEPSQQEALGIVLTVSGYTVLQAVNVDEALALVKTPLDAAILDVRLPDPKGRNRDGLTVLRALRTRQRRSIPVAVFTGIPLSDDQESLVRSHNATLFYKPQTFDPILAFLAQPRIAPLHPPQ
jgi:CheY-like chemotaxis protein